MDLRTVQDAEVRQLLIRHPFRPVLWGDLTGLTAADLMNVFHLGRRTGLLIVRSQHDERAIGFREGEAVLGRSTCEGELGVREVCFGLLREQVGSFVFLRGPIYALPEIEGCDVEEILLDGLRRIDEASLPRAMEAA